jgi:hypothetical protein
MKSETISRKDSEYLRADQPPVKVIHDLRPVESLEVSYEGQHTVNDGQTRVTSPGEIVPDNGQRQTAKDKRAYSPVSFQEATRSKR